MSVEELETLVRDLHDLLTELTKRGPGWEIKTYQGSVTIPTGVKEALQLTMYAQIVSGHDDVIDALIKGHLQSATTLQRTQMENLIRLAWLELHDDNALWSIIGSEEKAQENSSQVLKDVPHLSRKAIANENDAIERSKDRCVRLKSALPMSSPAWKSQGVVKHLPNLREMAFQAGLLDFYRTYYAHGCDHSHTSIALVLGPYLTINPIAAVIHPDHGQDRLAFTLKNSVGILWRCIESRRDLGWAIPAQQYHELLRRVAQVRPGS